MRASDGDMHAQEPEPAGADRDAQKSASGSPATGNGWETPRNIRILQAVVLVLGLILLAGFVVVIGRIIYLVTRTPAPDTLSVPAQAAIEVPSLPPAASAAVPLALPAGAEVNALSLSGERMAVHYRSNETSGILIVDLASGQVIRHFVTRSAEDEAR